MLHRLSTKLERLEGAPWPPKLLGESESVLINARNRNAVQPSSMVQQLTLPLEAQLSFSRAVNQQKPR